MTHFRWMNVPHRETKISRISFTIFTIRTIYLSRTQNGYTRYTILLGLCLTYLSILTSYCNDKLPGVFSALGNGIPSARLGARDLCVLLIDQYAMI